MTHTITRYYGDNQDWGAIYLDGIFQSEGVEEFNMSPFVYDLLTALDVSIIDVNVGCTDSGDDFMEKLCFGFPEKIDVNDKDHSWLEEYRHEADISYATERMKD